MRGVHFLIWLLIAVQGLCQDQALIDRDLERLQFAATDSERVVLLNRLCFNYADHDPDKGLAYGLRSLALAERSEFLLGACQAHGYLGYCLTRKSLFDSARAEYQRGIELSQRLEQPCYEAQILYNLGLNHQMQQQNDKALELFLTTLRMEEDCPEKQLRSVRLFAIGSVYDGMGRPRDALSYYQEALRMDSLRADTVRLAREHIGMANSLSALGETASALKHYDASVRFSSAMGDWLSIAYVHYNVGELFHGQGMPDSAVARVRRSLEIFQGLHRPAEETHAAILLGAMLNESARPQEAEDLLQVAVERAEELGLPDDKLHALRQLARSRELQSDPAGALQLYRRYMAAKDTMDIRARDAKLTELTALFETEKKERELETARAREAEATAIADRLRAQRAAYIGGALVLAALLALFISRYRIKRRSAEELARMNAELLDQKERAEESERAKDRFLANVSHEIRTPLNAIMGFTGLLMHEHRDERTARYLANIREAGDNLLVVINDVLDLSRIEAGRLQLLKEPFDLHRTIGLCEEILRHRAEEQDDELIVRIGNEVPRWALGDGARILQVLLNLVGNALKFTSAGSVELSVSHADGWCSFVVSDTGIGIPESKQATIFDRFSQVEPADQRRYGGMGLGLTIVKELVDLHGGTISLQSTEGRGTAFTVRLPLPASEPKQTSPSRTRGEAPGALAGHTILVAEDNEMNALVTTETLQRHYPQCRSQVVRTGEEALQLMAEDADGDIALVLMDVQMPKMDGLTATRRIRSLPGLPANVPIIALTASVLPSDLSRCLEAGMDACVSKPFKADELVSAIGRLTGDPGSGARHAHDSNDPLAALYRWLVPPRLKALRVASEEARPEEAKRIVHALRPQLVEHDERFADLCDRILRGSPDPSGPWANDLAGLIGAIEKSLS